MTGPNQFDWTATDKTILDSKSRNHHLIWRVRIEYPGRPNALPDFLKTDAVVQGEDIKYTDDLLINALERFITAFAAKYDGNKAVAFIQLGLLGYWGEWHTYPKTGLLPVSTMQKVAGFYTNAFKKTRLLVRYPGDLGPNPNLGYHDDSFGYATLDGAPNGGSAVSWFFWPRVKTYGRTDFWKTNAMGGETYPALQGEIFTSGYNAGTSFKQDFTRCVDTTHATFILHNDGFQNGGYSGTELENAKRAHTHMGYNFQVTNVVAKTVASSRRVEVTLKQIGVAPFYYPLSLTLTCDGFSQNKAGVDGLIEPEASSIFVFTGVPDNSACLDSIKVSLESEYLYAGNPIKFAQGNGKIDLKIPVCGSTGTEALPETAPVSPAPTQTPYPTASPVAVPVDPTPTPAASVSAAPPATETTPASGLSVAGTKFTTSFGDLEFTSNTEGKYPSFGGRIVEGVFDDATMVLSGRWVERGRGKCSVPGPDGSKNYGPFKFKFEKTSAGVYTAFSGVWGYCNDDVNVDTTKRAWNGTKK